MGFLAWVIRPTSAVAAAGDRIRALFEDDKRFWGAAAAVFGVVAIGKGIRFPSRWAVTQAQVDYAFGFTKRGLFGEVLHTLGAGYRFAPFALAAYSLLALLLLLLVRMTVVSHCWRTPTGRAAAALFAASHAVTYLAHMVGYLDIAIACIAVLVLDLGRARPRLSVIAIAAALGLLTHEMYLVAFLPVTCLPYVLSGIADGKARETWLRAGGLLAACAVAVAAIGWRATFTAQDTLALQQHIEQHAGFAVHPDVFTVFSRSTADNLRVMAEYASTPKWWAKQVIGALTLLPAALLFLALACDRLGARLRGRELRDARAAACVAGASPLLLHLIGWDLFRWDALAVLASFMVLLCVYAFTRGAPESAPPLDRYRNGIVLLVVLNLVTGVGLMDDTNIKNFPFLDDLQELARWFAQVRAAPSN